MRLRALSLAVAALAGLWLACADDYQENGPLTGDVGAKCFPDGSCKSGLICLSELCVSPPEAGTGSSGTTSSSSGSSEAGVDPNKDGGSTGDTDSGPDPDCASSTVNQSGVTPGVVCDGNQRCDNGKVCCKGDSAKPWACVTEADCTASPVLECDSAVDCDPGEQCCFTLGAGGPQACAFATLSRGICSSGCALKTFAVCDPQHPCNTVGQCHDRTLLLSGGTRLLRRGLCEPQ